jgi:hypothetical protein
LPQARNEIAPLALNTNRFAVNATKGGSHQPSN